MAVRIRLTRMGRKKHPFYRIVVANAEASRDGQFLEVVGTYDPCKQPAEVIVKQDRVKIWLDKGALPSETVKTLLAKAAKVAE
ncbi:MAG: 30S ribosomal protein S16 [Desulfurivibrionaceae bacterium]